MNDFEYIDGEYHLYEENLFNRDDSLGFITSISLLWLRYDEETYFHAKECMINNIPMYEDKTYTYNSYIFYQNANFVNFQEGKSHFPGWFTMACYNDTNHTLVFIGFYDGAHVSEEDLKREENWESFIDTYYGKYYDFSVEVVVDEPSETSNVDVSDTVNID